MRPISLLLSSMLVVPGLALVAGPASATSYAYDTTVVVNVSPTATTVYDTPIALTGSVSYVQDPSTGVVDPVSGESVTLQRQWRGSKTWTTVDTATTDLSGAYEFDTTATRNAKYKVTFAGATVTDDPATGDTTTYAPSSATKNVFVSRKLNETTSHPAAHVYYFKGNVDPGWGNKTVYMQRKTCDTCAWKGYKSQRTTKSGAFKFRVNFPKKPGPIWYYRIKVPGGAQYITSYSQILQVRTVLV
jgi:hypothetical protein